MDKKKEVSKPIIVGTVSGHYSLRWIKGQWRDKAGHIWRMLSDGSLTSPKHGKYSMEEWKIS